ncbi:hypothetical protein QA596_04575 [Balneolales bacterium ANBcel1]|nr:hypothetical protein [Balneolales bacterium ANBcel1]
MTSLSRIARLARIPEIRRKNRETDPRKKKRDEERDEDRPVFTLSEEQPPVPDIRREIPSAPRPKIRTRSLPAKKPAKSASDDGVGERLDLKV